MRVRERRDSPTSSSARRNRALDSPRASFESGRSTRSNDALDASVQAIADLKHGLDEARHRVSRASRRHAVTRSSTRRVAWKWVKIVPRATPLRVKTAVRPPRAQRNVDRCDEIIAGGDFSPYAARLCAPVSASRVDECGRCARIGPSRTRRLH